MGGIFTVGHRGASVLEPENTLRSFQRAIDLGVDYVECDVRVSRDGFPVVFHDQTLERIGGKKALVKNLMLEELKKLDVGKGEGIPTLGEVLELVKGKCGLIIELKVEEALQPCLKEISNFKNEEIILVSFHSHLLREIPPSLKRGLLCSEDVYFNLGLAERMGLYLLGIHYPQITQRVIRKAKSKGIKVLAWTVNRREDMDNLVKLGVDGIASDNPYLLREIKENA